MILGLPPEAAVGLLSTVGGFLMKQQAQRMADQKALFELTLKKQEMNDNSADKAYARKAPYLRKLVGTVVILVAFLGIYSVAFFPNIPVTIIEPEPTKSFLGIFEYGGGNTVTVANGLVIPDWFKYSVVSIVHFLFGTGAAKVVK
tara:strand:+ start:2488 stop:2922 length:435 start_codon:yes stop_codon:yes gene_type:complete